MSGGTKLNIEQEQRALNQLNKEIASLEQKMAILVKQEAESARRIGITQLNITKNTSPSILIEKTRQIDLYQKKIDKILTDKANINKKLADKIRRLPDTTLKLQKAEAALSKTLAKKQKQILITYEKQIEDLENHIQVNENAVNRMDHDSNPKEKYDVFLSYAPEDKDSFSDELSAILQYKHGLKILYQSIAISSEASIKKLVNDSIKNSKHALILLSRNYIKKYCKDCKLESLFQLQSNGGKIILPIWHDITKKEIQDFSPTMSQNLVLNTTMMTPEEISDHFISLFHKTERKNQLND